MSAKVTLILLSLAVMLAVASCSQCDSAAANYVTDYNKSHGSEYKLLEVSSCNAVPNQPGSLWMSLIMINDEGNYVSCLDVQAQNGRVVKRGSCY